MLVSLSLSGSQWMSFASWPYNTVTLPINSTAVFTITYHGAQSCNPVVEIDSSSLSVLEVYATGSNASDLSTVVVVGVKSLMSIVRVSLGDRCKGADIYLRGPDNNQVAEKTKKVDSDAVFVAVILGLVSIGLCVIVTLWVSGCTSPDNEWKLVNVND